MWPTTVDGCLQGSVSKAGGRQGEPQFALSPGGIIDLVAVLPFWLAYVLPTDFRVLLVLWMVRFLKLARYSPAIQSLLEALYAERRALVGCFVILMGTALFSATAMYMAEGRVQPDKLGTIPDAFWWAIVTLGTIGYGDVVPIAPAQPAPFLPAVSSFTIPAVRPPAHPHSGAPSSPSRSPTRRSSLILETAVDA